MHQATAGARRCAVSAFLVVCLFSSASLFAQQTDHNHPEPAPATAPASDVRPPRADREQYQLHLRRTLVAPRIDGLLDDEGWRDAAVIDSFTQQEPVNGQPATERTEVRVMYNPSHLFIAVRAYDSAPGSIVATEMRRDSTRMLDEDNFQVILDTFRDSRSGYMFVTNPLGAKLEQQVFEEGGGNARGSASNINRDWNGVWDAAARRTSDGWIAEMSIPMVTLRSPDVEVQTWGINFMRNIRHKNEQVYWSPIPKPYGVTQVSLAGRVTGMTGLNRGMDLRLKPYVIVGGRHDRTGDDIDDEGLKDVGLDLKYGLPSGLALDVTLNTDFAQAEVDEQQVNLSRFPLFFPEKRDFFLENSGQFTVSNQGLERLSDLFFSRRIGLSSDGKPIGILGGARLTGKVGTNNLAVMDLQTEELGGRPGDNFLVARYSKDISTRSKIGGLVVNKETADSARFNRTFAVDGLFAPTRSFSVQSFLAKTSTPGINDDQQALHARALFLNNKWQTYGEYTDIDDNFNAEVGFVPRRGIKQTKLHLERNPRPGGLIRVMEPMINIIYTTDQQNRLVTRRIHHMLGTRFQNGTYLNVVFNRWLDVLDEPFEIQKDVKIPVGTYRYNELQLTYNSAPAKRFYQRVSYSPQTFYDGTRHDIDFTLGVRASGRASGEFALQRNDVKLPVGNFVVNLSILRLDYALSPRMTIRSLSQYNSLTRQVTASLRYNFIFRPGSDLYVVYDEFQGNASRTPKIRNRQFVIKTTYLLAR